MRVLLAMHRQCRAAHSCGCPPESPSPQSAPPHPPAPAALEEARGQVEARVDQALPPDFVRVMRLKRPRPLPGDPGGDGEPAK